MLFRFFEYGVSIFGSRSKLALGVLLEVLRPESLELSLDHLEISHSITLSLHLTSSSRGGGVVTLLEVLLDHLELSPRALSLFSLSHSRSPRALSISPREIRSTSRSLSSSSRVWIVECALSPIGISEYFPRALELWRDPWWIPTYFFSLSRSLHSVVFGMLRYPCIL